jgi:hypothetical protein
MKRLLASGLGVALGITPSTIAADNVEWRAAGARPAQPTPPRPSGGVVPVSATIPALPTGATYRFQSGPGRSIASLSDASAAGWIRIRAQDDAEPTPVEPKELPQAPAATRDALPPPDTLPATTAPAAEGTAPATTSPAPAPAAPQACANPTCVICESPFDGGQGRAPRLQLSGEYLLWWTKGTEVPPLLTTSPPNGTNGIPGALPGSTVLVGGSDLDETTRHGARLGLVWWFDDSASYGFDGRYFFTGRVTNDITVSSLQADGTDIALFRPFFAPNTFTFGGVALPGPFREQITANGVASGSFRARSSSYFWGAEANYRDCMCWWCNDSGEFRADLLLGFRYLHLDEDITISEDAVRRVASVDFPDEVAGTRIMLFDRFATSNDFYGGQIGTAMTYTRNRWSLDLRGTVALGSTRQRLTIEGGQTRGPLADGSTFTAVGGLLALPGANIGRFSRDLFSVVPEIGLNLGYQVTDHLRAFVGYNFLYWSNVIRPGDQIDPVVDVTLVPRFVPPGLVIAPVNPPRPAVLFDRTDFWAQGINVGAEYRW